MDTTRFFPNPLAPLDGSDGHLVGSYQLVRPLTTAPECSQVANELLDRCQRHSDPSDYGSFYVGYLGVAYLEWRLSLLQQRLSNERDEENAAAVQNAATATAVAAAALADHLFHQALRTVDRAIAAAEAEANRNVKKLLRRVTLLEGPYVGAQALRIVLSLHSSSTGSTSVSDTERKERALKQAHDLIQKLEHHCHNTLPPGECDVLYGRAGVLQAIFFLRQALNEPNLETKAVQTIASQIIEEGLLYAASRDVGMPLLWEWHESQYLGAAHGVTGILYTLLTLNEAERQQMDQRYKLSTHIKQVIHNLEIFCFPSGNLDSSIRSFPPHHRGTDRLVQWCHGAPGHVLLLVKAAEVLDEPLYLERAKRIADHVIWPRGLLRKGVGLCHGIAGNAYAFLALAKHDASFIAKARYFADFGLRSLRELEHVPDRPYSLFEGLGGLCALVIDLADPNSAVFPLFY